MHNDQLGFDFPSSSPQPEPSKPVPKRSRSKPAQSTKLVNAVTHAPEPDLETCARRLESSEDFRVLRRLVPTLQWPSLTENPAGITKVIVLDTETTGLDSNKEVIIELALLRVEVDNLTGMPIGQVRVYDGLEDPGRPIPKEVVAITGITDDQVRGQHLDDAQIQDMIDGADLVIAHNAGFDRPFVERRLPQFAKLAWACSFADIDWKAVGTGSAKLENLAQAKGWFYDAHRAEMDCHALLAVLSSPWPTLEQTALAKLLVAGRMPSFKLSATNAPFESKDLLKARGYRWNADQRVWQLRLTDTALFQQECAWLHEHVYGQRSAVIQVETLDALSRYSSRPGKVGHQQLKATA